MNLLLIAQKIWRYKIATLPVLAFVLIGSFYVVVIKDPVYEASSSYILVNPPPPPTEDQINRDPSLAEVDSDNPFTRYSDQSVVVQVLAARLSSEAARSKLEQLGADPQYTVAPSVQFGLTAPIVQVTGTGSSPEAAVATANVVGGAVEHEIDQLQDERGVAVDYRITTEHVVQPQDAQLKASGQLRALVAVFALGGLLLFVVVSAADALNQYRTEHGGGRTDAVVGEGPLVVPLQNHDRDQRSHTGAAQDEGSAGSELGVANGSNGDSDGHPRPVIVPATGDQSDTERDGAAQRAERASRRPSGSPASGS